MIIDEFECICRKTENVNKRSKAPKYQKARFDVALIYCSIIWIMNTTNFRTFGSILVEIEISVNKYKKSNEKYMEIV